MSNLSIHADREELVLHGQQDFADERFNCEAFLIEIDFNQLAPRVVRELAQIAALSGYPIERAYYPWR